MTAIIQKRSRNTSDVLNKLHATQINARVVCVDCVCCVPFLTTFAETDRCIDVAVTAIIQKRSRNTSDVLNKLHATQINTRVGCVVYTPPYP